MGLLLCGGGACQGSGGRGGRGYTGRMHHWRLFATTIFAPPLSIISPLHLSSLSVRDEALMVLLLCVWAGAACRRKGLGGRAWNIGMAHHWRLIGATLCTLLFTIPPPPPHFALS